MTGHAGQFSCSLLVGDLAVCFYVTCMCLTIFGCLSFFHSKLTGISFFFVVVVVVAILV